jgi:hypothetical protein
VSNPDSFIDEVTEEVRRDRLFAAFRRYGWIAVLAVLGIVGGAAWNEWQKAQAVERAQAFGDALLASLEATTPEARQAALGAVPVTGEQGAVRALLQSSDPEADRAGAIAALSQIADDASLPQAWRDLAVLRRIGLMGAEMDASERRAALDAIAAPGRPFRTLALEQLAYISVETGETAAALTQLEALVVDQESPPGLRRRAQQMIQALGGDRAEG